MTTEAPTTDQLRNILDYVTADPAGAGSNRVVYGVEQVVKGAKDAEDALKKFKENGAQGIVRPIVSSSFFLLFFSGVGGLGVG